MRKSMKKLIALTLTCLMLATLFVGCDKRNKCSQIWSSYFSYKQ